MLIKGTKDGRQVTILQMESEGYYTNITYIDENNALKIKRIFISPENSGDLVLAENVELENISVRTPEVPPEEPTEDPVEEPTEDPTEEPVEEHVEVIVYKGTRYPQFYESSPISITEQFSLTSNFIATRVQFPYTQNASKLYLFNRINSNTLPDLKICIYENIHTNGNVDEWRNVLTSDIVNVSSIGYVEFDVKNLRFYSDKQYLICVVKSSEGITNPTFSSNGGYNRIGFNFTSNNNSENIPESFTTDFVNNRQNGTELINLNSVNRALWFRVVWNNELSV